MEVALSDFYCRGASHEKQRFYTISSLPPPLKNEHFFLLSSRRL